MRRRGVLAGVWAVATLAATLVGWAAVRQVTAEVSPSSVLPLPSAVALADGVTEPATRPSPAGDPAAVDERPDDQTQTTERQSAPGSTEAYELVGGVVTVRYRSRSTTLVSASPNSGFDVDVNDGGPGKVDVRFRSDDHESRLVTRWEAGAPDPRRDEQPR